MAEFLILNKDHWTHDLPQKDKDKWTDWERDKFSSASQRWDIIEAREDNTWSDKDDFNPVFCVVKVPGLPLKTAKQYTGKWRRKLAVQEHLLSPDVWQLDVEVVPESLSGLENLSHQKVFKYSPHITEDSDLPNGKRLIVEPPTLQAQKTGIENKIIIEGGTINSSVLTDNILTIGFKPALLSVEKVYTTKLKRPADYKNRMVSLTESGSDLLRRKIKKHRFRFEAQSQFETITFTQFQSRVKDKLDLTVQEII